MKPRFDRRQRLWPALLLGMLLAACETVPPAPTPPSVSTAAAEQAERRGDYLVAAREYDRLAGRATPPLRQQLELRAVDALIKAGQTTDARRKLGRIRLPSLDQTNLARKRLLEAKLLILEGAPEKALRQLDEIKHVVPLDPELLADIEQTRARGELATGNPFGAIRNLVRREQYLAANNAVADNQLQVWRILAAQPRARLVSELQLARDSAVAGWIELALAVTDAGGARAAEAITDWKKTHLGHPVGETLLATLSGGAPVTGPDLLPGPRPRLLALLLPLTSNISQAAQALRDGFLAMDKANANPDKPEVRVYDIGAEPSRAPEVYAQAVREGAQVVVGPLGREAAELIARQPKPAVPTLLLNHVNETGRGKGLYQFGLPPEQEARAVAERAWLDGHRRAAVLYPKDAWGERMLAAFSAQWQRLGGTLATTQGYQENQSDHSDAVKHLLNIHLSEARKAIIERFAGEKVHFEPRARQDLDFIFLAADAKRGRLIKPQLNFWRASRVPVYATSLIYTGRPNPVQDIDLDGVQFADMPWILYDEGRMQTLREMLQRDWPYAHSDLDRMYALGIDSYAILPHLAGLGTDGTQGRFSGVTSMLALDSDGRLQRNLSWARFRKGVPSPIDPAPTNAGQFRLDSSGR